MAVKPPNRLKAGRSIFAFPEVTEEVRIDFRVEDFTLDVRGSRSLDVDIAESVVAAEHELTIEGGSTLTVTLEDPRGNLLRSDVLSRWAWGDDYLDEDAWVRRGRAVDARLGETPYRLVAVSKTGTQVTLTFEERIVTYLRRHRGARKVSSGTFTRAQFAQMLVAEVKADGGIGFVCPELDVRQATYENVDRPKREESKLAGKGLDREAKLTVKGAPATAEQKRNMEKVLRVAEDVNAGEKATLALVTACIVESLFRNPMTMTDHDSIGILQLRVGLHGRDNAASIEKSVRLFLTKGFTGKGGAISIARQNPGMTAGQVAQAVQGSAFPDRYDQYREEGRKIIAAYQGGGGRPDGEKSSGRRRAEYKRGKDETSWDCLGRLAEEVGWRRFTRSNRLWFISERDLFAQAPRFRVREGKGGVDTVDFDLDMDARIPVAEVRLAVRAEKWTALPGMVVILEDAGPASGRWLISSVRGSLTDVGREVILRKPIPEKAEPRYAEAQGEDGETAGGSRAEQAYAAAKLISDSSAGYSYGGGHGTKLSKLSPRSKLDCSSSTSLALKKAGLFNGDQAIVSGEFARSWGKPGKGKALTVWANGEHVFIEFNLPGKSGKRFDTSPHGDGPKGPRLRRTDRSTAGFTPRHWPGV